MERHPVPQNIMEVQFKLFGSLTVKQFSYLAVAFIIGLIIYFTPLPDYIRYPLIFICAILGLFFSVGQINGQPSTVWVGNFIVALFSSQERIWRKTPVTPEIFKDDLLDSRKVKSEQNISIGQNRSPILSLDDAPLLNFSEQTVTEYDKEVDKNLSDIDEHMKFLYKDLPEKFKMDINSPLEKKAPEKDMEKKPIQINTSSFPENETNTVNNINKVTPQKELLNDILTQADLEENSAKNIVTENPIGNYVNIVRGVVISKDNAFISNAQIYVKDKKDNLLRKALSDSNGRFSLTTPLNNDEYFIDIEAKGCKFPRFKVLLNGTESPIYKFVARK